MTKISEADVRHLAELARIALDEREITHFTEQLQGILGSIEVVNEAVANEPDEVKPTSHPIAMTNVWRADEVGPTLTQEEALSGAPAQEDGRFKVPAILGEEQ